MPPIGGRGGPPPEDRSRLTSATHWKMMTTPPTRKQDSISSNAAHHTRGDTYPKGLHCSLGTDEGNEGTHRDGGMLQDQILGDETGVMRDGSDTSVRELEVNYAESEVCA